MFQRFLWLIRLDHKSEPELLHKKASFAKVKLEVMFKTVQEIAVYVHRFHNLDLFQQGWYQIKISMRWEDSEYSSLGTPTRVVQYEAPDLGYDDTFGIWRINDRDNSFSTQPFRIKYARQDILLSTLISFTLSPGKYEGPPTSAVILKFVLMYAPISENWSESLASLDPAAIHEFRIPSKALLGLHSYCPVHFDALHAVLVDVSIHMSLLKAGSRTLASKVPSVSRNSKDAAGGIMDGSNRALVQVASIDMKPAMLVKALLDSRNTLLEDLQNLSGAINQAIDMTEFMSGMDGIKLSHPILEVNLGTGNGEVSGQGEPQNGFEKANVSLDFQRDVLLCTLPEDDLMKIFDFLGNQLFYLWNTFLNFHRANNRKILKYLRDAWAKDRRAEWSIWMVCSKVEMPHHYLNSGVDEPPHNGVHKRVSGLLKLNDDPAQLAAMRAELHRRSIAQMKINNRFIQDMHIFGDPSRIPIVIVERVMNASRRTFSENSYFKSLDLIDVHGSHAGSSSEAKKESGASLPQNGRDLKIVVFVHGFQGHHLDLRLVRNQWLMIDPKIEFLMSEANEEKTSGDLREMGLRLAQEVISFLKKKMDKVSRSVGLKDVKLSFVGHSIGNVILRTALAESIMEPYLRYLYTYVSVSGPHLGYLYSSNSLFNSGLWLLKKLKNTQCIHQLTFTDDPDLQNTFFYKLSKDGYVPYHSARIELCQAASWDYSKKGKLFLEMLNNCLDQIRAPSSQQRVFMRCDVNFDTSSHGKNLNTIIGRAAHIEFLESDVFAKFVMWSFPELFR